MDIIVPVCGGLLVVIGVLYIILGRNKDTDEPDSSTGNKKNS